MIDKIVTGGQTGVDRAGLDMAIELGIQYGGWCPKGRIDENGKIPDKYVNLKEVMGDFQNDHENYAKRTLSNILDSDGTLILIPKKPLPENIKDGTLITLEGVKQYKKPCCVINFSDDIDKNCSMIKNWIDENKIKKMNIAGPRESSCPGIYQASFNLLITVHKLMLQDKDKLTSRKSRL